MKEVYLLEYQFEDENRVYGIYDDFIKAEEDMKNLRKFNECNQWGELHIIGFELNKLYIKETLEIIEKV